MQMHTLPVHFLLAYCFIEILKCAYSVVHIADCTITPFSYENRLLLPNE